MDYHHARKQQHRFRQKAWFLWQLRLAHKKELPLILYIRSAHGDALRILRRFRKYLHGGVCHCFIGNAELAAQYIELGFKIGIGGALLANSQNQKELENTVKCTPLSEILLETDCPYVKPDCETLPQKKLQKARNTSLILPAVAQRIATLKNLPTDEVERVTTQTAAAVFHFPLPS